LTGDNPVSVTVTAGDTAAAAFAVNCPEDRVLQRCFLDWSPDGARIAFDTDRDGNQRIYVMNADGSGQVNLTNSAGFR
jgi:hypothetical protein